MGFLERVNRAGISLLGWFGTCCLILMALQITLDVTLRHLFNAPLTGTIMFVSLFYMIVVAFVPLAQAEQNDAQISVEVVTELLPQRVQRVLSVLSLVISGIVFGGMCVRTWIEAVSKYKLGSFIIEGGVMIPTWPSYFFLPIGFGFACLVVIRKLLRAVRPGT